MGLPNDSVAASRQIYEYLKDGADPDAAVNGAVTPVVYSLAPPAGQIYELHRCVIHVLDNVAGTNPIDFGGIASGLTNGCELVVATSSDPGTDWLLDFFDGLSWKANQDLGRICYDVADYQGGSGSNANTAVQGRFTFSKGGQPVYLDGDSSEEIHLEVHDNLSSLLEFTIHMQGRRVR